MANPDPVTTIEHVQRLQEYLVLPPPPVNVYVPIHHIMSVRQHFVLVLYVCEGVCVYVPHSFFD